MDTDNLIRVEGSNNLYRDPNTNAIVNINKKEIEEALKRKRVRLRKKKEEQDIKTDIDELKKDMENIKSILFKIAEKL